MVSTTQRFLNRLLPFIFIFLAINAKTFSQQSSSSTERQAAPAVLPGKGLAEFDFLYAGEAKVHNIYIVRKGKLYGRIKTP